MAPLASPSTDAIHPSHLPLREPRSKSLTFQPMNRSHKPGPLDIRNLGLRVSASHALRLPYSRAFQAQKQSQASSRISSAPTTPLRVFHRRPCPQPLDLSTRSQEVAAQASLSSPISSLASHPTSHPSSTPATPLTRSTLQKFITSTDGTYIKFYELPLARRCALLSEVAELIFVGFNPEQIASDLDVELQVLQDALMEYEGWLKLDEEALNAQIREFYRSIHYLQAVSET